MATKQGINAGRAFIELLLDDSPVHTKLNKLGTVLQKAGRQFAIAGAVMTAPFALATRAFAEAGKSLKGLELLSNADAKAAIAFSKALGAVKYQAHGLALSVGAALAPVLSKLLEIVGPIIQGLVRFIDSNRTLIQVLAIAGAVMLSMATAVYLIGTAFRVATGALVAFQVALAVINFGKWEGVFLLVGALVALAIALGVLKNIGSVKISGPPITAGLPGGKSVFGGKFAEQTFTSATRDDNAKVVAELKEVNEWQARIHRKLPEPGLPAGNG